MNSFDAAVYILLLVAVVTGFNAGLLRSLATISGYLAAMPVAVAATPLLSPVVTSRLDASWEQKSLLSFGIFLIAGIVLGALSRSAVNAIVGPSVSLPDRLAGSVLGAVRIGLVAVTMVLIFDQIIPPDLQPDFLKGSRLRPALSTVGHAGLKSLPADVTAFIDRLKKDRGI